MLLFQPIKYILRRGITNRINDFSRKMSSFIEMTSFDLLRQEEDETDSPSTRSFSTVDH